MAQVLIGLLGFALLFLGVLLFSHLPQGGLIPRDSPGEVPEPGDPQERYNLLLEYASSCMVDASYVPPSWAKYQVARELESRARTGIAMLPPWAVAELNRPKVS